MFNNEAYPWYAQNSVSIKTLYDGFYPIAEAMTPLGIGDAFNIDILNNEALFTFGTMFGMSARPQYYDGLIYDVDRWSEVKVWSGHVEDLELNIYKNFLRMKAFIAGKPYSLNLLKDAFDILTNGLGTVSVWIEENNMSFIIHLDAPENITRLFMELNSFDLHFLGKPSGVSYTWDYVNAPQPGPND